MEGIDTMMKFRTAYLKAIARSWNDPEYLERLHANPIAELNAQMGVSVFPWDVVLEIQSVDADESLWDPVNAGGWVGRNAVISIWLPPPPAETGEWARAWAAYYNEFPSFLGTLPKGTEASSGPVVRQSYPVGMGHWNDFLEFTAAIMRLVAMAWKDPQVLSELRSIEGLPQGVKVLNKWLGYLMAWNMDVEFKLSGWFTESPPEEKACRWNGESWPIPGGARPDSCRNGLKFYIPNKPNPQSQDRSIEAIALSAYNVTGDQYPFTCP